MATTDTRETTVVRKVAPLSLPAIPASVARRATGPEACGTSSYVTWSRFRTSRRLLFARSSSDVSTWAGPGPVLSSLAGVLRERGFLARGRPQARAPQALADGVLPGRVGRDRGRADRCRPQFSQLVQRLLGRAAGTDDRTVHMVVVSGRGERHAALVEQRDRRLCRSCLGILEKLGPDLRRDRADADQRAGGPVEQHGE